jgi:hypothetical protein
MQQIVLESMGQGFSIFDIYNKYHLDQRRYNYLKFIVANWNLFNNRTILAWDLGRNISLCRWGYQVGFLTEDEAWEKIMYYARKIQSLYNSWDEYGNDYYLGRVYWASGSGEEIRYMLQTDPLHKRLVTGFWNNIDWYTKLTYAEENDTAIETIRFQKPADNDGVLQYKTNDSSFYDRWSNTLIDNPWQRQIIIQCNVKKISGDDDYGFGVLFCVDDSVPGSRSLYRLFITVNGRFTVQKMVDGNWLDPPVRWRDSPFIRRGYNVYNHISVEKVESNGTVTFKVYFNDDLAVEFTDEAPLNGTKVGLAVSVNVLAKEMFPHIPVDVRFDY